MRQLSYILAILLGILIAQSENCGLVIAIAVVAYAQGACAAWGAK